MAPNRVESKPFPAEKQFEINGRLYGLHSFLGTAALASG